jgi:signal transduction histidine kinase
MRFRTWPVAALGLAGLLALVVVSVLAASRRAQDIYTELDRLNSHHRNVDATLRRLRADVHLSGIFVRDYLLDTARERAPEYRQRLAEFRDSNLTTVAELQAVTRGQPADDARTLSLQSKLEDYWRALDPVIDWTTAEKISQSARFLRREVLPRREAVLAMTQEIEELNNANLKVQREEVTRRQDALRAQLYTLLWRSVLLGAFVALTAVIRLRVLERRSEQQRAVAEEAERQMRALSQQLVAAQEEERKKLSRELHDHVGQVLTALRLELGRIDRLRSPREDMLGGAVAEARRHVDDMVRTVRDLALGLRPSMLDDLGLQPALEWYVRDFTRRYGIPVELSLEGDIDRLTDQQRTSVYRIVQEALTNCARHAQAGRIAVRASAGPEALDLSITDDGVGLTIERGRTGFGLRGIEERVRELGGVSAVRSSPGDGTTIAIQLPLIAAPSESARESVAG